jgi:hypothetical protein
MQMEGQKKWCLQPFDFDYKLPLNWLGGRYLR